MDFIIVIIILIGIWWAAHILLSKVEKKENDGIDQKEINELSEKEILYKILKENKSIKNLINFIVITIVLFIYIPITIGIFILITIFDWLKDFIK